jgi:eukaryotic-like serine/threonine-protein kinase
MTFEDPNSTAKKKVCPVCKREFPPTQPVCPYDKSMLMYVQKDELLGTILNDRYRVLSEVGRGGMSIVYKGLHEMMDRTVAIKMLQSQHVTDQLSIKRFQQEAQAASHLQHPNVITVYDCGVVATGQPYIVMDFLEGQSLTDIIKAENHISYQRCVPIFVAACDALEHAHQKGVIHRDLKSSNIMLVEVEGRRDFVKVVDFGIAKLTNASGKASQNLTQTGEIFGSPIYMSPEQCLGLNLDSRSDIYSMGAVLYEALTGLPPLMGDTIYATMKMHVSQMPEPFNRVRPDLQIPENIERATFKALAKKPEQRFQTMQEMRDALEACMTNQFETGSIPSLISAPPSMGFSSNMSGPGTGTGTGTGIGMGTGTGTGFGPGGTAVIEDFDLSGGLFGPDPGPAADRTRNSAPYISGPDLRRTEAGTSRGTSANLADSRATGSLRSTGVRKPAPVEKKKKNRKTVDLSRYINRKTVSITLAAILIPGSIAWGVSYLNSLGNDNPFAMTKDYSGTIWYYRPATSDEESGKDLPEVLYLKTVKDPKPLKVDLSEITIGNFSASEDTSTDLKVGRKWRIKCHKGPNNSFIMDSGGVDDNADKSVTDARQTVEKFFHWLNEHSKAPGDGIFLKDACKMMSSARQKQADEFVKEFGKPLKFKEGFVDAFPPYVFKVTEAKKSSITILVDAHHFLDGPAYYEAKLVSEDQQWRIDSFTEIAQSVWNKTFAD